MRSSLYLLTLPLAACMTSPPAERPPVSDPPAPVPAATPESAIAYPATRRGDLVETHFGTAVSDPYRWLENDVREDNEVKAWVDAQNAVTQAFLARLPEVAAFRQLLARLYDYERYGAPKQASGLYFFTRNSGLQNQAPLYVRQGAAGAERMLIDPNSWSADAATALAEWAPSRDGKHLVYAIQDGGTDWRTLKVIDVATGRRLADEIKWVKYSGLDWAADGSGFYYSRFDEPKAGAQYQSTTEGQEVYFHKLGTAQSADRLIYSEPGRPKVNHSAEVSGDGKWLIITTWLGTDEAYEIRLIDLTRPRAKPIVMIGEMKDGWTYAGNVGTRFYWRTDQGAQRGRIVVTDPIRRIAPREVVAEDEATLTQAGIAGGVIVANYLKDAQTVVRRFSLGGEPLGEVALPGVGAAEFFFPKDNDGEAFFGFASFNQPVAVYRYDGKANKAMPFALPKLPFDPANVAVEQRFFASKDGTRVPMFVVRRKDLPAGPRPALLYGYGGFNNSELPRYQARWMAWVEAGGVLAVANLRGGGEYGKGWHEAGRRARKQNVFDDFIAAGENLIATGVTTKGQLAIEGRSNGGLLVGAVINQRPDLFAAALPGVGVMDMLRFHKFTAGRFWTDDYGDPGVEADFRTLWAYSPYHNIKSGVRLPPMLITTADTDDRVTPGHSFKYAAAVQAADPGGAPHLIRIETRAGHGTGKPTSKLIDEYADSYGFAAHFTGLKPAIP